MKDYNIENYSEKINSEKTKKYFKEVVSSYFNENYRASIVTLYSVVINDILIKLETLEEVYSDETAKSILKEIKEFQLEYPTKADWEKDIVEKVKNRTKLFDNTDYAHILSLRNDRHFCAHPVLNKEEKLYTPSKENVASHIRNMLEALLTKPAILSKKILQTILIDISGKKDILFDKETLEKYLKSKYLKNLNENIEVSIFRELWKFVYKLEDEKSDENRLINYRFITLLYNKNRKLCQDKIKSEIEYFGNIPNNGNNINFIIRFLSENEFLLKEFKEHTHLLISKQVEKDASAEVVAWFLSENYQKHIEKVKELIIELEKQDFPFTKKIETSALQRLINIGISKGFRKEVIGFIIWNYSVSNSYYKADTAFANILMPNVELFEKDDLINLCNEIKENSQIYSRNQAEEDHNKLKKYILHKVGEEFPFKDYKTIF